MAYSLTTLRNQIITSIYGRRLGLDQNGALIGHAGERQYVEDLTTTAASTILAYGHTRLMATGSTQTSVYTLENPRPGITKTIAMMTSSTGCQIVAASSGALFYGCSVSTVGSTCINFLKAGAVATLFGESSVAWRILDSFTSLTSSDARGFSFTTTT